MNALLNFMYSIVQRFYDMLRYLIGYMWNVFWFFLKPYYEQALYYMPVLDIPDVPAGYSEAWATANHWVPLEEAFYATVAYLTFYVLMIVVKFISNHIPLVN